MGRLFNIINLKTEMVEAPSTFLQKIGDGRVFMSGFKEFDVDFLIFSGGDERSQNFLNRVWFRFCDLIQS